MVNVEDAVRIIERLSAGRIQVWVCGGWGIDALLGRGPIAGRSGGRSAPIGWGRTLGLPAFSCPSGTT
jgi:hypothetical protein